MFKRAVILLAAHHQEEGEVEFTTGDDRVRKALEVLVHRRASRYSMSLEHNKTFSFERRQNAPSVAMATGESRRRAGLKH
jgi:hypothetical protein